jgi:hypothetical protein
VPGDLAKDVHGNAGIGHPGQAGVTQAVSAKVFITELSHDVVPVGGVAQDGGGDTTAAGSGEWAGVGLSGAGIDAPLNPVADLGRGSR